LTFKKISSEIAYRGRVFNVRHDVLQGANGRQIVYDTVVHNGAVTMIAVDAEGQILLVRQYRHSAGKRLLELPAGTLNDGESPEACAQRELREEVGMAPGSLTKLAEFFLAPGYSTERMWIFLARDLRPEKLAGDEDEDIEVERMTLAQCIAAIHSGEIEDAKTVVGIYLAQEHLAAATP
jgi:ADP-ribose pyrophosphatase